MRRKEVNEDLSDEELRVRHSFCFPFPPQIPLAI